MRTVPHCDPTGRAGMPQMPTSDRTDCRHGHGAQPHAVVHLVLGRLPGRQPDPRHVGRPVPTATWALALRDSLSDPPQTARRNGPSGPGSHRWPRERACRGGRNLGRRSDTRRRPRRSPQGSVEVRHRNPGTAQDKRKDGRYAGRVRLAVAADRSAKSLCGFVDGAVAPGTLVVTDDWSGYASLRKRGYDHHAIAECGDPEVAEEFLPITHLVFANLKTWLIGIHHGVSAQHLQAYLNEFTFRFNRRFYPFNAFRSLLGIAGGVEAPTYAELYSGAWVHPTSSGCLR